AASHKRACRRTAAELRGWALHRPRATGHAKALVAMGCKRKVSRLRAAAARVSQCTRRAHTGLARLARQQAVPIRAAGERASRASWALQPRCPLGRLARATQAGLHAIARPSIWTTVRRVTRSALAQIRLRYVIEGRS